MAAGVARIPYDGISSFPDSTPAAAQTPTQRAIQLAVTGLIVTVPFAGLVVAVWLLWGHAIGPAELGLGAFFYLLTGFGVTVGFHRCLTHRSFTARPALRVMLAIAGSMSFQGDVNSWVATHRRHHAFTDRPGDPHSPYRYGTGPAAPPAAGAAGQAGRLPQAISSRSVCITARMTSSAFAERSTKAARRQPAGPR